MRSSLLVFAMVCITTRAVADDEPGLKERIAALEARVTKDEKQARPPAQVSGFVNIDWVAFRQSSQDEVTPAGQPLNEDRFTVRRARIRIERDHGYIHGAVELDANTINGPQVRPWNAEVSLKFPAERPYPGPTVDRTALGDQPFVMVSAGLLVTPFGFEVQELERRRPFLERSTMSNALVPQSFDLGVRVMGGYRWVNWALGIMNGDPIGDQTFPGRDPNESKDLVFRVGGTGKIGDSVRLTGGFSGLTGRGFHTGTKATKDQLVWRDTNENGLVDSSELSSIAGAAASPSQNFSRFAVGVDARLEVDFPVIGTLALRAEAIRAKNLDRGLLVADPVAASRDLRERGFYVGGTQQLGRYFLAGVRHDLYRPDDDASEQRTFAVVPVSTSLHTTSFLLMARLPGAARLVGQYDLRRNENGRATNGAPTNLKDDSFTIRGEVSF